MSRETPRRRDTDRFSEQKQRRSSLRLDSSLTRFLFFFSNSNLLLLLLLLFPITMEWRMYCILSRSSYATRVLIRPKIKLSRRRAAAAATKDDDSFWTRSADYAFFSLGLDDVVLPSAHRTPHRERGRDFWLRTAHFILEER